MRKALKILLLLCLLAPSAQAAGAGEGQTPYEKFLATKGLKAEKSFITLYKDGDKLLLEIPDSVVGRRVLLTSVLRKSSDPSMAEGTDISAAPAYRIAKTDSLVLFMQPAPSFLVPDGDSSIVRGLRGSVNDAVLLAFPIEYRTEGSVVVKADAVFDPGREGVASLKGLRTGDNAISSSTQKKELSSLKGITSYTGSVGVLRDVTFAYKISGIFGEQVGDHSVTALVETCLTLMPERETKPLKADSRIGTRNVVRPTVEASSSGIRQQNWVSRWKIDGGEKIRIYVDTLLASPWKEAVCEGLLEWNKAFAFAGRPVIEVEPYPADGFNAADPLVSTVSVGRGGGVSANISTDPASGEILSCKLVVSTDFVASIRREGMVFISDVDTRYQNYDVPSDALAEALRAKVMSVFGLCLGMTRNMAGSHAYSPGQLRDPAFTAANGITASVTDDVLFNIMARPGDRERGVATVVDRLGQYDLYAIRWMYDDGLDRDGWLSSHEGREEYLYLPLTTLNADPRGIAADLGNDPFATFDTVLERLKWVASNGAEWISGDEVGEVYKDLFADYVFLGVDRISRILSYHVGGIMASDRREGATAPKFTPVPADVQRRAIQRIVSAWRDMEWFNANKELLLIAGANNDANTISLTGAWAQSRLAGRLDLLAMSGRAVEGAYSLSDALLDIEDAVTEGIRSGKSVIPGEEYLIAQFGLSLFGRSPILSARSKEASHRSLTGAFGIGAVPKTYTVSSETELYAALKRYRDTVKKASRRYRGIERERLNYALGVLEAALDGNKR